MYDLSIPQKSIWITEQFYKNTNINNITGYFNIKDEIQEELLEEAINIFIKNNDNFRTRFFEDKQGKIQQKFSEYKEEKIEIFSLKTKREFENLTKAISNKRFKIIKNKLYNFYIYKFNDGTGGIIFSAHHLVLDAWTMSILINDIANIYYSLINGISTDNTIKQRPSYKEYIEKEKEYLTSSKIVKDQEYWKKIFSENISIVNKENLEENIEADRKEFTLDVDFVRKLREIDKSFLNIIVSALSIYFSTTNNYKNILIGLPLLNRSNFYEKQIPGMFVNTVPFKIDINKDLTFKEFLEINKKNEIELFRHQKLSYTEIFKIAKAEQPDINNLFNMVVSYQNARDNRNTSALNYDTGWIFNKCISNALDIHITDLDNIGKLKIFYDYQVNRYSEEEILNLHNRLIYILKQILDNRDILIKDIEVTTPEEKEKILKINDTKVYYPSDTNIIDLFNIQVKKNPNKIAVIFENKKITYKELDIESDRYAQSLINNNVKKRRCCWNFPSKVIGIVYINDRNIKSWSNIFTHRL